MAKQDKFPINRIDRYSNIDDASVSEMAQALFSIANHVQQKGANQGARLQEIKSWVHCWRQDILTAEDVMEKIERVIMD